MEGDDEVELFTEEELKLFRQSVDNMVLRMLGLSAVQAASQMDDQDGVDDF